MTTFSGASCQAVCDNVGKLVIDALALLPSSLSTLTTDLSTEVTRIQALSDALVNPVLGFAYAAESQTVAAQNVPAGNTLAWLNSIGYAALVNSHGPWYICDALDFICSQVGGNAGLSAFLVANTLVVDAYFADTFNAWVNAVIGGGYIRGSKVDFGSSVPAKIAAGQVFPHVNVDTINTFTLTSSSVGTLAAGTSSLAALTGGNTIPGFGILEAYAGNGIGGSSYTITATYTNNLGVTGQTMTFTIPSGTTINTVFTPSGSNNVASIQSVAITTGTGTTGDIIKFRLKPVRSIAA